jgi:hypothetical protein
LADEEAGALFDDVGGAASANADEARVGFDEDDVGVFG